MRIKWIKDIWNVCIYCVYINNDIDIAIKFFMYKSRKICLDIFFILDTTSIKLGCTYKI